MSTDQQLQTETDEQIATACVNALKMHPAVPEDRITVTVRKGWVTLEGDIEWEYQKIEAENAVRYLSGVLGVTNLITVKPRISPGELKSKVEEAFKRTAELDARRVIIEVEGGKVILRGRVSSRAEKEEAERVARSLPGVSEVESLITDMEP
jgi:osmotically-inducible protein OsmY